MEMNAKNKAIIKEALNSYLINESKIFENEDISEVINSFSPIILNESITVGDEVIYDGNRGYITGETQGKLIVQVQGSTFLVTPKDVKLKHPKADSMKLPYKFDKVTLKNLCEQQVRCGIYQGNTPIKISGCYVNYNSWNDANDNQHVPILVEGKNFVFEKTNIRILEDVNEFANPDNYVEGVVIDPKNSEAIKNVMINIIDYTHAVGDDDEVRVFTSNDEPVTYYPRSLLRTLSV
jgi:hypothetical protein